MAPVSFQKEIAIPEGKALYEWDGSKGIFDTGLWGRLEPDAIVDQQKEADPVYLLREVVSPPKRQRNSTRSSLKRIGSSKPYQGPPIQAVPLEGPPLDLDWCATIKAWATRGGFGSKAPKIGPTILLKDLLKKKRKEVPHRFFLFLVDISGSMGRRNLAFAKQIATAMLYHTYLRRDRVALAAFKEDSAELLVHPSHQSQLIEKVMVGMRCGGLTPLAMGLKLALRIIYRERSRQCSGEAVLILISDGRGNVGGGQNQSSIDLESAAWAGLLRRQRHLKTLLIDTTEEGKVDFQGVRLADWLGAKHLLLWRISRLGMNFT